MEDRTHRCFTDEDVTRVANTYHEWRKQNGQYADIKGFCKSAPLEEDQKHSFVLTPGRYVGIPDQEDDGIPFEEKMKVLTTTLKTQMEEEKRLDEEIKNQLAKIGFNI